MPVLSEATVRSAHAKANSAWEITSPDPNNGGEITTQTQVDFVCVAYTDFDGNKTIQVFKRLKDASVYTQTIETFWKAIDKANKCNKATKASCYQEILTLMGNQVSTYGKDFLPHDLKKAVNEIEEYLNIEKTIW
jgi:hypothetical protein